MANVSFRIPTYWKEFFRSYGVVGAGEPNEKGWVNFPCILPTHKKRDKDNHGSANYRTGHYKCWSDHCREAYQEEFETERETLTAKQFLILKQRLGEEEAETIVEAFRTQGLEEPEKVHLGEFSKVFAPEAEWGIFVLTAQKALQPDLEIVQEYLSSRGLRFETVAKCGMGYVPEIKLEDGSVQEECLIHPYYQQGRVVGIRGRTFDGRKGGVKNGYATLFQLQVLETSKAKTAIICEGETDTYITRQLLDDYDFKDIPVLGTPGNDFKKEWSRHIQYYNRVIALPQTDVASDRFVRNIRKAFPLAEVVTLPFPPQSHGKDVSDFLRLSLDSEPTLMGLLGLSHEDYEPPPYILSGRDLVELSQQEIPWLVPNLIERGTKVLVPGAPKTYKTFLLLQLADAIVSGTPFLDMPVWGPIEKGRALLVEEEGSPHRLGQRWSKIASDPTTDNFHVIHRQGTRLDDDACLQLIRRELAKFKPNIILLDPYASMHTQDENTVQGTMIVMSAIDSFLRVLPGVTIVIVHHTPKNSDGARGSGALWGAMDLQIEVKRPNIRLPEITLFPRGRDLPDDFSQELSFKFDPLTYRLKPCQFAPKAITESGRAENARDRILHVLREDGGWLKAAEIKVRAKISETMIHEYLRKLKSSGYIVAKELEPGKRLVSYKISEDGDA